MEKITYTVAHTTGKIGNNREVIVPTTAEGWNDLRHGEVYEDYVAAYNYFMFDKENANCWECPENCDSRPLPCGQQKCWVDCHHEYREENEN